jgi:hypothetical protein
MDAMRILRDEWEEMSLAGDHFSLDTPAHVLAYVRAKAFAGAEAAERWQDDACALRDCDISAMAPTAYDRAFQQFVRASEVQVAYLRVLAATVELFAPAPRQEG